MAILGKETIDDVKLDEENENTGKNFIFIVDISNFNFI